MGNRLFKPKEGRWEINEILEVPDYMPGPPHVVDIECCKWVGPPPKNDIYPPKPAHLIKRVFEYKARQKAFVNSLTEEETATRNSTQSAGRRKMKKYKQKRRKTYRRR